MADSEPPDVPAKRAITSSPVHRPRIASRLRRTASARLHDYIEHRDEEEVEERRRQHATRHGRSNRMPRYLPRPRRDDEGRTPRMNASDVIRMGRRRMRAASIAASTTVMPRPQLLGELDDQIGFFAASPIEHDQPTWQYTIVGKPARPLRRSAPRTATGTPSSTMNGSTGLRTAQRASGRRAGRRSRRSRYD